MESHGKRSLYPLSSCRTISDLKAVTMSVNVGNEICVAGSAHQQQQPVKKRVYDECAPEIRRITEVRANKKRASQYSQAGNDDSTAISRSSFNSSSPSILSLMSSDELAQQLERSALRLADSMKRSEESRSRVLKSEQTCEPDDAANQQSSSRSRSPFGLSSLVSSGIVSYVGHMTSSSTLY
mmetsp:Transcript_7435/g.10659  ORF Transcript_7435/g.10659 Transcript_7435/m.10659 type:complete len:182 (-) Transcript_7435:101-646(-)